MKKFKEKAEAVLDFGGTKKDIILLAISGIALILSICGFKPLPFDFSWVAVILCGVPIIAEAIIGLVTEFDIKADVLVSIALVASLCIHEDFAAGEIAFIMQLGGLLEDLTVAKARAGIERLVKLTPQTARKVIGNDEKIIPASEVKVGDIIRVFAGETIAVDGEITSGETSVNQAVMTGESLPVDKTVGDKVSSGTVNQYGTFEMRAEKVGEDSSIQRMIRLVQSADAGKAKIVGIADRWATWIVITALTAAAVTWLISGEIIRAVTILVVFCPCSLVLATPTAIMAAIGNATKKGFLVRQGDALERLAQVTQITFDKTGTLTNGTLKVNHIKSFNPNFTDDEIRIYAATAEKMSEHPIGKAITACCGKTDLIPSDFEITVGKGVKAQVNGKAVMAGNLSMLCEKNITVPSDARNFAENELSIGSTVVYVAIDGVFVGLIALSDTLRTQSENMIAAVKAAGVTPILLTGDNQRCAKNVADAVGIDRIHCECLPEDKLNIIAQGQSNGEKICMIGDGINDAPALKKADVGIAMGSVGSDIAVDAADIAIVDDDIKELPHLIMLSKRMMRTIKFNLSFSMLLNFVAIVLAITGILSPVVGALVHNAGSVFVIINSSLLLKWRNKQ